MMINNIEIEYQPKYLKKQLVSLTKSVDVVWKCHMWMENINQLDGITGMRIYTGNYFEDAEFWQMIPDTMGYFQLQNDHSQHCIYQWDNHGPSG